MVFYIEACESGSMMEDLPKNINGESLDTNGEEGSGSSADESADAAQRPGQPHVEFTFIFRSAAPLNAALFGSVSFERRPWPL